MIHLYTWNTPNGRKVSIALEWLGLPYRVHPVDITQDEQFRPDFLAISPNNRIPAITDDETGLSLFESGAILLYLAEKTGKLLPADPAGRWETLQWLMWQMGGVGPMFGQAHHFVTFNPGKAPYAEDRYRQEATRLYGVLDRRLANRRHIAGDTLTIADMAVWPWTTRAGWQGVDTKPFASVRRWYRELAALPSFQAGYGVPDASQTIPPLPD